MPKRRFQAHARDCHTSLDGQGKVIEIAKSALQPVIMYAQERAAVQEKKQRTLFTLNSKYKTRTPSEN